MPSDHRFPHETSVIYIRLLGTAAGGGLPQWNCACANCDGARQGLIPARTQSSVAVSAAGERWFLVNASPDLRAQIESFPALHPGRGVVRASAIRDVLLTNADFDHVLGLFMLREPGGGRLRVHCTAAVRDTLRTALRLDALLAGFCGIEWRELPGTHSPLRTALEAETGLTCRAIPLPGDPPRYADGTTVTVGGGGQSVALEFVDRASGKRLLVAPDVAAITPDLRSAMAAADAVLFDGTFWSEDELRRVDPAARPASDMGHLPISRGNGGGSLEALRDLRARPRVYVHVNNTNPIFSPGSPERTEVEGAGVLVGEDGMEFTL